MTKQPLTEKEAIRIVQDAWWAGVRAVNGYDLVLSKLNKLDYSPVTHVLAIGKAASSMMLAIHDYFKNNFKGLVITKYGHLDRSLQNIAKIETIESGHPVPDQNSLKAGQRAVDFIGSLNKTDNLLVLVSGGASSLAEKLKDDMSLQKLQLLNDGLLAENKTISQINAKRSKISLIKKGKLLNRCEANSIFTLAISDVQGDDINIIGSGIGACDLPNSLIEVIGSNNISRDAISNYLSNHNFNVICNQESLYGDLHEVAKSVTEIIITGSKGAYVFGGEVVISLPKKPGVGGRNQSLALAIAKSLRYQSGIIALVAGSDGTDGPTQAAGGIVDTNTFEKCEGAQYALDQANAGEYLEKIDALFVTGPTGTNVMDLLVAIKY